MTTVNLLLEAAHHFADAGIPVLPCRPGAKTPLTARGLRDATTDPDRLRGWWTRWPEANVAIATGAPGYDVLDVDVRVGGSGRDAFEILRRRGLLAGALGVVGTPSGGFHVYFPGTAQRSGSLRGDLLDFKATGGYVLAPPSRVAGVGDYSWHEEPVRMGGPLDWQRVRRVLRPTAPGRVATGTPRPSGLGGDLGVGPLAWFVAEAQEGNRNNALFWAVCQALRSGYRELSPLRQAAMKAGLDEREIDRAIRSARQRAPRGSL
jgi:hypothetical protein